MSDLFGYGQRGKTKKSDISHLKVSEVFFASTLLYFGSE
jgi:hypothetical protein